MKLDAELQSTIKRYLEDDYSPEQVFGVLKKEGKPHVSHETIYKWIWADKKANGTLHTQLRRKGRRYRKRGSSKDSRGKIIGRIGIENRPKEAENLDFFGHFEIDAKLNNRPRKRYAYENPIFVMEKLLFNSEVAFVA